MTFKGKVNGFLETIFRMFILISTFTAIDMIYHYLYETNYNLYAVPLTYYLNKILIGTILGIFAFYMINYLLKWRKYSYKKLSLFSAFIVIILQIRYFTTGHFTLFQNIVIGFAHYFILIGIVSLYYKIYGMDYLG